MWWQKKEKKYISRYTQCNAMNLTRGDDEYDVDDDDDDDDDDDVLNC